jgi:Cys-tRNA(Pro) deacylase
MTDATRPPGPGSDHRNVERVTRAAAERGLSIDVQRFPAGTRTAQDAARAVGCDVAQIVKSLVFVADGQVVIALVSGADRLDVDRLGRALSAATVRRANADEAREATGFAIGGIPPLGHRTAVPVVIDDRLLEHETVWAAAGLPDAVFAVAPAALAEAAGARIAAVAADPS